MSAQSFDTLAVTVGDEKLNQLEKEVSPFYHSETKIQHVCQEIKPLLLHPNLKSISD